jgi:CubicO group peptidase (beta-lactamase class C family)
MTAPDLVATRPEDVGIDSEKLEAVFARAKRDVDNGVLPSAQVAVARNGRLAGFRTFGVARINGVDSPATNDTLYTIFSSTKALVAAAVWTLFEDGLLRLDERRRHLPEFATNGKEVVTVEQAMLHIGGFPMAPLGPGAWETREGRLQAFSRWRLNWEPGSQFQYHATSLHWVLMEIIERRTGTDGWTYLRRRILQPMGLNDMHLPLPADLNNRVADVFHVEPPVEPPGGWGEVTPDAILNFNRPETRAVGVPGGGGIANAAQLALFYQPLVNGGDLTAGGKVMKPETIEFAILPRTKDHHRDPILGHPINRALAVQVAGDDGNAHLRGFGNTTSSRAFGHGGAGGQIGWGDPETGLSVGYCTNGFVDPLVQGRRITAISSLAASASV